MAGKCGIRGIDEAAASGAFTGMGNTSTNFADGKARVIGSVGDAAALAALDAATAAASCDMVEIRLDLLGGAAGERPWVHLAELPLLMTARSEAEGGAKGLADGARMELLEAALADAALADLEVASIPMAGGLIARMREACVPWVGSFHDFGKTPELLELREAAAAAREAGAAVFKAAAMIRRPGDLAVLADFQLEDHGIAVATMGMGPLAVVSRLLCAQCGSVLNYGYLGGAPTAPGQWDCAALGEAMRRLGRFS
jgi:3-dehydroquinate dehydratase-1